MPPETAQSSKVESLSQSALDALFGANSTASSSISAEPASSTSSADQSEIDALLSALTQASPAPKEERPESGSAESLSQSDLEALFGKAASAAPSVERSVPEAPARVGQSEIEALLASAKLPPPSAPPQPSQPIRAKSEQLSQEDLDALFSSVREAAPAPMEIKPEDDFSSSLSIEISQDELDSAVKTSGPQSFGSFDLAEDNEGVSQEAIDKLLSKGASAKPPKPVEPKKPEPSRQSSAESIEAGGSSNISQEELDRIFSGR